MQHFALAPKHPSTGSSIAVCESRAASGAECASLSKGGYLTFGCGPSDSAAAASTGSSAKGPISAEALLDATLSLTLP